MWHIPLDLLSALSLLLGGCLTNEYIIDDSNGYGRRFDGIGGLSGGGATSRLLVNYPEPQRTEILDYLFRPNYGASLHILKVEIGGDSQTTDGSEASHMHNMWEENYNRGYEWWLMAEAKKRNPDILLYGLPWAFPGWVGDGTSSPYTNVNYTVDYITRWIQGAQSHHNLTINYIGIWNERAYDITYIMVLRKALDTKGFKHVKIVASDNKWSIVSDPAWNSTLSKVADYVGVHYPATISPDIAIKTGTPLWASEDFGTFNDNTGAGCWARMLNYNYINGFMSATISWNLISSFYMSLPYPRTGLMTATEPWSGHYTVNSPIWATSHTTQFTRPGWRYFSHGSGVGKLDKGGSYVSLSDGNKALTVIIETMSHNHSLCYARPHLLPYSVKPQKVTFKLNGTFSSIKALNVFYTKLYFNGSSSVLFERQKPIIVQNGLVTLQLGIDEVYTLTTLSSGNKGKSPNPPPPKAFPLPYSDDFDTYPVNSEPNNFAQQVGSFEVVPANVPERGKVLRQVVLDDPIDWCPYINLVFPMNLVGNSAWDNVHVEADVRVGDVNGTTGVFVASRIDQGGCESFGTRGIFLFLFPLDQKFELSNDLSRTVALQTGAVSANFGWNTLGLTTLDNTALGYVNGKLIFNVTIPNEPSKGFAGIGSASFGIADFDNFNVTASKINEHNTDQNKDTLYFDHLKP